MLISISTRDILIALLMKLFSKVVDSQFGSLSPENFASFNGSCYLKELLPGVASQDTVTSWIYSTRYLLPVLGGLLADACIGYIAVLHICGHLMFVSCILLAVAIYFDLICRSVVQITIAWALVPPLFSIIQPCIVYCIYRWHREPRMWTVLNTAYYLSMKIGEIIGILLPLARGLVGKNYILVGVVLSIAFLVSSRGISTEHRRVPLGLPTRARLFRYFKIFSPFALFIISIIRSRSMVYTIELRHYLRFDAANSTAGQVFEDSLFSPEFVKVLFQLVWCLPLLFLAYRSPKHISIQRRIQAGIFVKAVVDIGLIIISVSPPNRWLTVHAIFWVASAADGAAELLTIVAALEIMNGVAPSSCKMFVMGIGFTVWGLAALAGRSLVAILSVLPSNNPVLQPAPDRAPLFFVYHVVILLLLVVCSAYFRFVSYPLVEMLFLNCDFYPDIDGRGTAGEPSGCSEETPLIEYTKGLQTTEKD